MTVSAGLVIGGVVQPGTGWILRDSRAWWAPIDSNDVRSRAGHKVELLIGHWTAGHHHEGPDAVVRIYRAIEARERADGTNMAVSCSFIIAADGQCWQTCDIVDATIHVGDRRTYLRSAGVEIAWCGTVEQATKLGIPVTQIVKGKARGRTIDCVPCPAPALAAWVRLVGTLTAIRHPAMAIPRELVPYDPNPKRGPLRGIGEHRDIPSTLRKVDAGGLLVDALRAAS